MPEDKPGVQIEYCTQCGLLLLAAWIAQELLRAFEDERAEVALRPGSGGDFIVRLNSDVPFSPRATRRFPEAKEFKLLVRDASGSAKRVGCSEKREARD